MTKSAPEKIITTAIAHCDPWSNGSAAKFVIKALTDAGYEIVDREPSEAQCLAGMQAFDEADYEGDWRREFADVYRAMTQQDTST